MSKSKSIVQKTLRYAEHWLEYGYHPTRLAMERYIDVFDRVNYVQEYVLQQRWDWMMENLPMSGGSGELQEFPWQMMAHCYRWGRSLGITKCKKKTYILVPRKNGKTDIAARIGIASLYFSKSVAPNIYSIATRAEQAGISHDFAETMLIQGPLDEGRGRKHEWYAGTKEIQYRPNNGKWRLLPTVPKRLDGLQADLYIIDEGGQVEDAVENVIDSGLSKTVADQHILSISTAGGEPNWFTREIFHAVDLIEAGGEPDINVLVWAVPETRPAVSDEEPEFNPETDIGKEETWKKTNPCYNITIGKEETEEKFRKAKLSETSMMEFCRTRINMFTSKDVNSLCSFEVQKRVSNPSHDELVEEKLLSLPTSMGIDISRVGDPTSICVAAIDGDDIIYFKTQNFITRHSYEHRIEKLRAMAFPIFEKQGSMIIAGYKELDYDIILDWVIDWAAKYGAPSIYSDTATQGMHFRTLKTGDLGIPILDFGQSDRLKGTRRELQSRTKNFFIDCLLSDMLKHPESDRFRWELNNAAVKIYPDDRKDIIKLKGQDSETAYTIDGIYSCLHAIFPFTLGLRHGKTLTKKELSHMSV